MLAVRSNKAMIAAFLSLAAWLQTGLSPSEEVYAANIRRNGGDLKWVDEGGGRVLTVDFGYHAKPLDLKICEPMKRLEVLRVLRRDVVSDSINRLASLPKLRVLVILTLGPGLDNKALGAISRIKTLEKLDVKGSTIDNRGIAHLMKLKKLARLYLYNTKITDRDIEPLRQMPWLRTLVLPKSVTTKGIESIRSALSSTEVLQI